MNYTKILANLSIDAEKAGLKNCKEMADMDRSASACGCFARSVPHEWDCRTTQPNRSTVWWLLRLGQGSHSLNERQVDGDARLGKLIEIRTQLITDDRIRFDEVRRSVKITVALQLQDPLG